MTTVFWLCEATAGSRLRLACERVSEDFSRRKCRGFERGRSCRPDTGDWVLARYKGGQYWYPGIVQTISSERLTIAYDDGDRETLNLSNVRPYD